jgi:predicted Zn-dependent peptidase
MPPDLELEREVVLEEIAQVEDTPDDLVFELHGERLWNGHPYGRSILGTKDSVSAMTAERLRELHAERYSAGSLLVAAAGNVRHEAFSERVRELFGGVAPGEGRSSIEPPPPTSSGVERSVRGSAQTHIVFGTNVPRHSDPDRYALVLTSSALGGGMSSRLFQRVREELGLCYSIYAYQSFYSLSGVGGVYVGTRPATADTAARAVREELAKLAADGLPEPELEQVKRQVKGQLVLSLESSGARLYRLASFALHDEPLFSLGELLDRIDAVSADDVSRVAREYFQPERQLELRLGPE